jgi:hypothetical protein
MSDDHGSGADLHHALPANRAFVVQFRASEESSAGVVGGRIEHLMSGSAKRFDTWAECGEFVEKTLTALEP